MACNIGAGIYTPPSDTTLCGEPVNGDSACCAGTDRCMENSICHFTRTQANTSGYYVQGCTNPSHLSDACSSRCYETFQAPPPDVLKILSTTATSNSTSTSTSTSSASSNSSSTAATVATAGTSALRVTTTLILTSSTTNVTQANLPTRNTPRWSGFDSGAKAGIAVGVIVGVLALLALALFLFQRRCQHVTDAKKGLVSDLRAYTGSLQELCADYDIELDSRIRVELDARTRELELGRGVKVPSKGSRGKNGIGGVGVEKVAGIRRREQ
ncbi:MAG: hypothetical protein Q9228_003581 [Teloschistes exilis]